MTEDKKILDPTCGSRMMWFDKNNPNTIYGDIRSESHTLCDGRALEIRPDIVMDFTELQYDDDTFKLVVFDPPHLVKLGANSWLAKKFGKLPPTWQVLIKKGFDECMRVLQPDGVLIFKWNQFDIKLSELLRVIEVKPLFGHTTDKKTNTIWLCFMKH